MYIKKSGSNIGLGRLEAPCLSCIHLSLPDTGTTLTLHRLLFASPPPPPSRLCLSPHCWPACPPAPGQRHRQHHHSANHLVRTRTARLCAPLGRVGRRQGCDLVLGGVAHCLRRQFAAFCQPTPPAPLPDLLFWMFVAADLMFLRRLV